MSTFSELFLSDSTLKFIALIVPVVLVISMVECFHLFARRFSAPLGYLLSLILYWLFWCLLMPSILLGGIKPLLGLFKPFPVFDDLTWKTHLLLWWPVAFPLFFVFIPRIMKANAAILLASLLLGIIIGLTEEILWRGVYITLFPGNIWLNLIYPSLMFAVWHIAPQSVVANRMPGGAISFVAYAFVLGVSYSLTVYQTKSIAWCTLSHILHDSLGLGGFSYAAWLNTS
jgi:membrane protease YdiL (CAAX protease family)